MGPVCVTRLCYILCELPEPHGAEGATLYGKPQHCKRGHFVWESVAKHDTLLYLAFITACSDLWAIHQRKCKNGKTEVSIVD
jgi:hypothetical protein